MRTRHDFTGLNRNEMKFRDVDHNDIGKSIERAFFRQYGHHHHKALHRFYSPSSEFLLVYGFHIT